MNFIFEQKMKHLDSIFKYIFIFEICSNEDQHIYILRINTEYQSASLQERRRTTRKELCRVDDAQRFEESEAGVFFGASSNAGVTSLQKKGGGWSEERQIIGKEGRGLGYCCWFRAEETRHRAFNRVSRTISYLRKQRCKWGVARFSFRFLSFRFVSWMKEAWLSSPFPSP